MPAITQREIKPSYELAKQVYERELHFDKAIAELVDKYGMNEESAKMSIHFFQYMMKEKKYSRSLSNGHIRYYLENVLQDYDKEGLRKFLNGLELHINYRKSNGFGVPGLCKLHNEFSRKIGLTSIF